MQAHTLSHTHTRTITTTNNNENWMHARDRRFVLQFFLADGSLSIFEPPVRNSGVLGGRFLERMRLQAPASSAAAAGAAAGAAGARQPRRADVAAYVGAANMFVGARLVVMVRCVHVVLVSTCVDERMVVGWGGGCRDALGVGR